MKLLKVNTVVGLTASSIMDLYYALNNTKDMKHFLIRNEMNGGYLAFGTSRLTSMNIYKRNLTIAYSDLGP